ncbi:MAG: SDR family oxidoreductase [Pyrinomonadaceae bacterium]
MQFSQTIFITGFPGFIAGRLVERLAAPDVQFFLLVQSQLVTKAISDAEEISRRTGAPLENFALIEGDITLPDLGIDPTDAADIRAETTDVFHLAAMYDLDVAKDVATRVNVDGTKNVNAMVRSVKGLRRYNYVSTCYVAGKRKGRIFEHELEHDAGFRNYYEESKYLAEIEVENLKRDLPVTIFRPSVVVGDSITGETVKYDGIYYLIHYIKKAPHLLRLVNVGNDRVRLNLVPVDFVIEGIASLARDIGSIGKTIALADPQPLTTKDIFDAIAHSITKRGSLFTPPAEWVQRALMLNASPGISGLPHSTVPYFFISQSYDTTIAKELLDPHGITCPNFRNYLDHLLKFVDGHPKL